jgi:hypothetical protein
LVTLAATPAVLKIYAAYIHTLGDWHYRGMAYAEVDWPNGEVQVFRDYRRRVSAARVARREVLADLPNPPARETLNPMIWQRGADVRHQRRRRARTAAAMLVMADGGRPISVLQPGAGQTVDPS